MMGELIFQIGDSFIAWEGSIMKAKLYAHQHAQSYLENALYPFRDNLKNIGNIESVSVNYPNPLEWLSGFRSV
jgi:hypothetical protein